MELGMEEQLKKVAHVTEKLRETLKEILNLKVSEKTPNISISQTSAYMLFLELKQLNRRIKGLSQEGKNRVQQRKKYMDGFTLKAEAILYEKSHLMKRINKYQEFGTNLKKITLRSKKDFLKDQTKFRNLNDHECQLKRLADELSQRKSLLNNMKALRQKKKALLMKLNERKQILRTFEDKVGNICNQTVPLLRLFPSPCTIPDVTNPLVEQLPAALYNLYYLALHHQTFFEADLMLVVKNESTMKSNSKTLKPHPFCLVLESNRKGVHVSLIFQYFPALQVVALKTADTSTVTSSDLLNLYPADNGETLPNCDPSSLDIDGWPRQRDQIGMLYYWVQILCGLHHSQPRQDTVMNNKIVLDDVLDRIHARSQVLTQLGKQYACLGKNKYIFGSTSPQFPSKLISTLIKWSSITEKEYNSNTTKVLDKKEDICSKKYNKYFHFVFSQEETKLQGYVSVGPDYPEQSVLFTLDLKDIESKVNNLPKVLPKTAKEREIWMLSYQVRHCQALFEKKNSD